MSKFVQDPFMRQIRSAITGDAVGLRLPTTYLAVTAMCKVISVANAVVSLDITKSFITPNVTLVKAPDLGSEVLLELARQAQASLSLVIVSGTETVNTDAVNTPMLTDLVEVVNLGIV